MLRILWRSSLFLAALFAMAHATTSEVSAQNGAAVVCRPHAYGNPDLFYNFYVPPNCGGMGAEMYLAPRPVPQLMGHTYYTYQPFMPHEYLYHHHRSYHRYYDDGRGLTRTHVKWSHPHVKTSAKAIYQQLRIPR